MTVAYCFSCGTEKASPIAACGACKKSPATEPELVRSLILTDEISTLGQLAHFANEVRSNFLLTAPDSLVAKARVAASDPRYQRMLTATQLPRATPTSASIAVSGANIYTQGGILREAIGIETLGSSFTAILAKGSKLPCLSSQTFSTGVDDQDQVTLHLCSGDSTLAKIIQSLGRYQISGIAPMPRGTPSILVELNADLGGVTLKATDNLANSTLTVKSISQHPKPIEQPRAAPVPLPTSHTPVPRLTKTAIHQSAFAVLGVTTRDNRKRIVELAEEKSLELDHDVCQKARSDLTNPRNRLSAEIAWLPGVSPRKTSQLLENLLQDPMTVRKMLGLPTLAHLNLLAAAFQAVDDKHDSRDLASFILEVATLADALDPEDILRDINEDRAVSGFPDVQTFEQIEAELAERKRYYRNAIKEALNRLPPTTLIQVMTETVDVVTAHGEDHAPELIDELVDSYEVETQSFLQKEAENVHKLIKAARDSTRAGEAAVKTYVDKLAVVARNWDKVAQPIQLSAKARGINHAASRDLAYEIRSLAIDLFNKHDMLTQSQRLTGLLQELFAEIPEVSERVEQDADALADIFRERGQSLARKDELAREITYLAEIGVVFKDTLSISPNGLSWKGQSFPLETITRVRWGGVRHSVNGVPTGTNYTIAFGDSRSEAIVELKKEDTYNKFVDKLWRAVCVRLLGEMLEALKTGRDLYFGESIVHDNGITLVKHKFLGANEKVRCSWAQVQIWNADGSFCIGSKDDKKTNVAISHIHVANTHILEQAIRMAFKKSGVLRLSDLFQ